MAKRASVVSIDRGIPLPPAARNARSPMASEQPPTMSSSEIATLVESRHDSVKRAIERLAERGAIVPPPLVAERFIDAMSRPRVEHVYRIGKRDSYVIVAQLSPEFTGRLVDRWMELESRSLHAVIIPQSLPDALRLAADLAEQKAIAEAERDQAIATKAEIGSRREATAMATASAAKREAERLRVELDQSKRYASTKRMEIIYHGLKFSWHLLKRASDELDLPPIKVFDANYGTVNAYHADAWRKAYALEIDPRADNEQLFVAAAA